MSDPIADAESSPEIDRIVRRLGLEPHPCLLYTSDAADDSLRVDLGGVDPVPPARDAAGQQEVDRGAVAAGAIG